MNLLFEIILYEGIQDVQVFMSFERGIMQIRIIRLKGEFKK